MGALQERRPVASTPTAQRGEVRYARDADCERRGSLSSRGRALGLACNCMQIGTSALCGGWWTKRWTISEY